MTKVPSETRDRIDERETYGIESVVLLEAFFKNGGLFLGQPELLSGIFSGVFVVAQATRGRPLDLVVFAGTGGLPFAGTSLSTHGRDGAVRRRHSSVVLVGDGRPVHVDSFQERRPASFRVPICTIARQIRFRERNRNGKNRYIDGKSDLDKVTETERRTGGGREGVGAAVPRKLLKERRGHSGEGGGSYGGHHG